MDKPLVDISATGVRERIHKGYPVSHQVPAAVARYIEEQGLYKGGK